MSIDLLSVVPLVLEWLFGRSHPALLALFVLMLLDLLTQRIAQQLQPGRKKGSLRKNALKKILQGCLMVAAHQLDQALGQKDILRNAVLYVTLGNELLSITEHMARAGVPIPAPVTRMIQALRNPEGTEKTRTW